MITLVITDNEVEDKKEIGERLREYRRLGGQTQADFAAMVGSPQQTVSKYERGVVPSSWLFLSELSNQGIDLNELLSK